MSCNLDYKRVLHKGKSFECSKWQPFITYTNDCLKQDFVTCNGALFVCLETHLSSEDSMPKLVYGDPQNPHKPTGTNSKYWEYVLSGFSDWDKLSEDVQKQILESIDGLDTKDTEIIGHYVSSVLQEDGKLTIKRKELPSAKVSTANDLLAIDLVQKAGALDQISIEIKDIAKNTDLQKLNDKIKTLEPDPNIVETSWLNLKVLRDWGKLTPGTFYRITDYITTTIQENTRSAGHQFDIIATALDESTLSEEVKVIKHQGDEYFLNANLNAWQVWYSLDNDTDRFAWADVENGKGVIYKMIDEWNNECPYDFKNIQFLNEEVYYYTFNWNDELLKNYDLTLKQIITDNSTWSEFAGNNIIKAYYDSIDEKLVQILNNIIFKNYENAYCFDNAFGINCFNNIFGNNACHNKFGSNCSRNEFRNDCGHNILADLCDGNIFTDDCLGNVLDMQCGYNALYHSTLNKLGKNCFSNVFRNSHNNFLEDNCSNNIFAASDLNVLENQCFGNDFMDSSNNNILQANSIYNYFGNNSSYNKLNFECMRNRFTNCSYNVLTGCARCFLGSSSHNNILTGCSNIKFGNYWENNVFGENVKSIKIVDSNGDPCIYVSNINVPANTTDVTFINDEDAIVNTGSSTAISKLQNYTLVNSLQGPITLELKRGRNYETKIGSNSNGEIKMWCEADLID